MRGKDKTTCYMCDAIASTLEHAPPKCFFPEEKDVGRNLRVDLITVPSCMTHNTARTRDDEYAMMFVVSHFETGDVARTQFASKCMRALRRKPRFAQTVFDQPKPIMVGGMPSVAVKVDLGRFKRVMEHTCRAIFYHHHGEKLVAPLTIWSLALHHGVDPNPDPVEATASAAVERLLADLPRIGQNAEVFWYQLGHRPGRLTAFRLQFYDGFSVHAFADQRTAL